MQLVFILSLPRTGSTLLQRLLSQHPRISTVSESWLLLPFLHPLASDAACADYSYRTFQSAQQDLFAVLPNGQDDYLDAIRQAGLHIYTKLSQPDTEYFLDKTPRYHLIAEQIFQTFPDAKYIILWRHPLATAASMLQFRPPWNLYDWYIDLYRGFENLYDFQLAHQDSVLPIRYEDLVLDRPGTLEKIFNYLHLEYSDAESLVPQLGTNSQMGDKKGTKEYLGEVSTASLNKWKSIMSNPVRKYWCQQYLHFLRTERLEKLDYHMADIENSLSTATSTFNNMFIDLFKISYGCLHSLLNFAVVREKIKKLLHGQPIYPYS